MSNKKRIKKKGPTRPKQRVTQRDYTPQLGELQQALVTLQRMYDQSVIDKASLQNGLQQSQATLAALLVSKGFESVVISPDAIETVASGQVEGLEINQSESPKGLKVELIWASAEDEPDETPL